MSSSLKSLVIFLLILFFWLAFPRDGFTAEITKIKGQNVLITDTDAKVGDSVFAVDSNNKKRAIIEITKAKGGKAVGRIVKGKASEGFTVIPKGSSGKSSGFSFGKKLGLMALFGYGIDSQSVPISGNSTPMTGTGFSGRGGVSYDITPLFGIKIYAGVESFSVQSGVTNGVTYQTNITYGTVDGLGVLNVFGGGINAWIGAGGGLAIPLSKTTNALSTDSIAATTLLHLAAGADIPMTGDLYMPLMVDYALFVPPTNVVTSIISLRAGLMLKF